MIRSLTLLLLTVALARAQNPTATLAGEIRDPSGSAIANARVSIRNVETNIQRAVLTSDSGQYLFPLLPPGSYELVTEAPGFRRSVQSGITLQVSQDARLDVKLELGQVNDVIQVVAEAPQTATESAASGTVIENRKVIELPLNSREFYGLALLVPGAYAPAQNSTMGFRGGFNVAGATETSNNFTVNGIDNNDTGVNGPSFRPSVDSIQEFKLLTGVYPAEYGRGSGGQVVVVTKSGTNQLRGGLFEFLRNQVMDARNYFTPSASPAFKRNQFGGTLGGPIRKDKTFFFYSYEGLRLRQQVAALATVPLQEMKTGDFRSLLALASPRRVLNPFTGLNFRTPNVIDPELLDSLGVKLATFYPAPNRPTPAGALPASNYNFSETRRETLDQNSIKVDHTFSANDSLTVTYNRFTDPSFEPSNRLCGSAVLPGFGCDSGLTTQLGGLTEVHVFSPTLINEFRAGVNRLVQPRLQEDVKADFPALPGAFFDSIPDNTGLPSTSVTGFSRLGGATNLPSNRADTTYQIVNNLSWITGKHSVKFGIEWRQFQSSNNQSSGGRGSLNFTGATTALTSGYPLADMLLGLPTSTSRNPYQPFFYNRQGSWNWFVQDDYKITPHLTLNVGLRWEYISPLTEKYNRMSSFDADTGVLRVMGQNGVGKALYKADRNNFAPRFGFAWQPFGKSSTVIRGGYGVFYNPNTTLNGMYTLALNAPFRNPQTFNASRTSVITLKDPFPTTLASGSNTAWGINQDFPLADRQQWSLGVQRQLTTNVLLEASYFGAKGTHLQTSQNPNQPAPGLGTTAQVNARRRFPTYGNLTWYQNDGNSNFHSLQAKLEKRFSAGLSFLTSYTYGKSIDDAPGTGSTSNASNSTPQNSFDRHAERGLSDFDVRHRLVWSPIWNLPFGKGGRKLTDRLMQNWEVSGIFSIQTGRPLTPYLSVNTSNTFGGSDRPNLIGDPNSGPKTVQQWFSTAAFAIPAVGNFGNAGRNIIQGPGLVNVDVSFSRNFYFRDKIRLQFRGEAFNLANHPNFSYPNATADNPSFGQVAAAGDPRQIQLALRLAF
ncbi:MAG: TonB-dependent receptor [Acidobacteria bacterium]|nr:TonB-dependent receptor [Acidobacteriota bacterium]